MTRELYVSSTPHETKVALVEDDQVAEIFFERENEYTLAGSIYKGRVTRVLPGMQSAFVDIGLERDAFLYVSDFLELPDDEESEFDEIAVTRPEAFVSNRPAQEPTRYEFKSEPAAEADQGGLEADEGPSEGNTQEFAETDLPPEARSDDNQERFRGNRRRRRGRRGRGFPENKFAHPASGEEQPQGAENREQHDYSPPAGYQPILLPGESLSKYRGRDVAQPEAGEEPASSAMEQPPMPPHRGTEAEQSQTETEAQADQTRMRTAPFNAAPPVEDLRQRLASDIRELQRGPVLLPGESIAKYQARDATTPAEVSAPSEPSKEVGEQHTPRVEATRYERQERDRQPTERYERPQRDSQLAEKRERNPRERPDYAPRGGFAVLPGETIAKYRNPSSAAAGQSMAREQDASDSDMERRPPEAAQASASARSEAGQVATFVIESEPWAEASQPAEPAASDSQSQAATVEPESRVKASEAHELEKVERMNVAAVFGGEVAEPPKAEPQPTGSSPAEAACEAKPAQPASKEADSGELDERIQTMIIGGAYGDVLEETEDATAAPTDSADAAQPGIDMTPESLEPAAPDAPAVEGALASPDAGSARASQTRRQDQRSAAASRTHDEHTFGHPGEGTLEHEEIEGEEEETGFHSAAEEDADSEYMELEEETLEAQAAAPAGEAVGPEAGEADDLTEAVEESDVERAVMSDAYETEEEGEFDEDTVFEEEELQEGDAILPEEQPEEAIGRAELRGPSPTAGYQRAPERVPFDRRNRFRRPPARGRVVRRHEPERQHLQIADLLKEGQEVLIQIAKEPIGKKGARITSHIALPGRFLVYMPTVNHVGVSRKITSEEERQRLKRIMLSEREGGHGGFIVRTAAAGVGEDELRADIRFLKNLWLQIKQRAENGKAPALIYHDLNLVERILRDQVTSDFAQIWVDTEQEYERILNFANRFQPSLVRRVKLYTKDLPLFEQFGIHEEINKALKAKVWLKSGGYIVINQTEALVAIDINTGKYVGKTARLEDTIVKTNVDAIKEIVRQIRLRDLGGIIVIDFIDMDERKNRQKVMQALEEALRNDRAPSKVLAFNDFGLVAITRKRVKQSLERTLGTACPYCTGNGFVKSVSTVCNEIYVELRKIVRQLEQSDIVHLRVNPEVAKALKAEKGKWLADFEELTRRTVLVKADPMLHQEQFDVHG